MNYKKLKLISVVTLLMMPMIVLADSGESFISVAIGIEAFVTIHMSLFVLMPLSKILKYDLTEQKRLFWKMFWIRVAVLLILDFIIPMVIMMIDFFAIFIGAFLVVPFTLKKKGGNFMVNNIEETNTNAFCTNCGNKLDAGEAYCTNCGSKVSRSIDVATASNAEVLSLPSASQGKPFVMSSIAGYTLNAEQMTESIIKKEIKKTGETINTKIAAVEKKKNIFSIVYAIILFICVSLFFFHSHTMLLIVVFIVVTIIYINSLKNYNVLKYLIKEVKSRPGEKIGYIVSSVMSGKIENDTYKFMRIAFMIIAVVIPMFIFRAPHTIYEYDDNLDGYVIRFYTIGWLENDKELEIPEEYKNEPVVGIRGEVFANVKTLRKVVLPDTIKEIRGQAFQYASNLEEINLPEGIPEIKGNTFEECNLKEITIPDSVTRIGGHAFRSNSSLEKVNISPTSKLKEIGSSAFRECYELDEIYLPRDVSINERAFKDSGTIVKEYYGKDGVVLEDVFEEKYSYRTSAYITTGDKREIDTYRSDEGIEGLMIKLQEVERINNENTFNLVVYDDEGSRSFPLYREVPYKTLDEYGITVYIDSDYLFDYCRTGVSVTIYYN